MVIIGILFIVLSVAALSVALGVVALPDRTVRDRLLPRDTPTGQPTSRRMRQLDQLKDSERRVMSGAMFRRLQRNLVLAGHPDLWSMRNIALVKVILPVVVLLIVSQFAFGGGTVLLVVGVASVVIAYFVPDLLVHSRASERQDQIQRELPDVLDKIVISIEAGLGFEASLAKTARTGDGPLSDELVRTVQDISLGMGRRDAYEALQRRTSSEDLISFIRGVTQAEEHGSSMSSMVHIQSKEMRLKRKLRAEGKAGKVSIKLLAPLMACIFPVLFIVVLAPGIINAAAMF
ncbi:type II secretion system F family protein [Aeromicrobium sp. CF4.19]|uniref:type II secretion system F family protein n=1 Tax=Aeromicrobium sp. CF4.19 TaxID=3373082 RepID=UPI003EE596FA